MDKYEYNLKLEEIKKLVEQENYEEARALADTIDWRRVRNVRTLCMVSEIYEACGRLEDSRDILLRAYRKSKAVRSILFRLTEISIKLKNFDDAAEYYSEFVNVAPHDNSRFLLKYKIYKGRGASIEDQIDILEEYNEREYTEKYAYEVAKLYYNAGDKQRCVEACDKLILWFRQGKYVIRALELKQEITELTPVQQAIYDNRNEATLPKAEMVEAVAPELEKVILENMPDTRKEVLTDDMITETETELAQVVTEHMAAQVDRNEESRKDAESWSYTPPSSQSSQSVADKDYGFNTADLQAELAKNMRDILSGIVREPDESDIVEPQNDIANQEEPVEFAAGDEGIEGQMTIDDILMAMSSSQQEASATAEVSVQETDAEKSLDPVSIAKTKDIPKAIAEEMEAKAEMELPPEEKAQSETEALPEEKAQPETEALPEEKAQPETEVQLETDVQPEENPEQEHVPTELTDEQRYMFSYFSTIGGLREQIAAALYTVMKKIGVQDRTSRTGNMVVLGAEGSGKSTLAIRFARCIAMERGLENARIAKIYAEDFNKKDIASTVAKIAGGTLIIEEAGDLEDAVVDQLSTAMEFRTDGLLVVLEDDRKYLKELFDRHPTFAEKFTAEIRIPVFTNDELVAFGCTYALDNDYKIDGKAMEALSERISDLQTSGQPVTVIDVKEIVDQAIRKAEKFSFKKIGMILSNKRYDEDDRVILYVKDFE